MKGHISFLAGLLLLLSTSVITAQSNYEFFPYYNQELMEDLRITPEQVQQMRSLDKEIGERYTELNDALLYYVDYNEARVKLEEERAQQVASILTADQKTYYDQFQQLNREAQREQQLNSYKEMYMDLYAYLNMSYEQAEKVAAFDVEYTNNPSQKIGYKEGKEIVLQDVLTDKQWETYQNQAQKEQFAPKSYAKQASYKPDWNQQTEILKEELKSLKNIYLPERAAIRQQLEETISGTDKKTIAYLRTMYEEIGDSRMEMYSRIPSTQQEYPLDYMETYREYHELRFAEVFESGEMAISSMLHKDRETFNLMKELAIRYDGQIDALQAELEEIEQQRKKRQMEQMQSFLNGKIIFSNINGQQATAERKNYLTDKVELERNIAFLLIQADGAKVVDAAQIHRLQAYPLPAAATQTIEFDLRYDGETTIEIVDAAGKVIQQVFKGDLQAGKQRREVNLGDVQQSVFFYRISSAEGTSLLKSAKM